MSRVYCPHQHIIGLDDLGNVCFQSVNALVYILNDNPTTSKRQNSTKYTQNKLRLRERTDRAWFSRLVYTTSGQETERVYSYNAGAYIQCALVPDPARGRLSRTAAATRACCYRKCLTDDYWRRAGWICQEGREGSTPRTSG